MNTPTNTHDHPVPDLAGFRDVLDPVFVGYVQHESTAQGLRAFQPTVLHGLLQTRAYTLSLATSLEKLDASAETTQRLLAARQNRQALLDQEGGPLHFIFDESVLVRPPEPGQSGLRILRDQIRRLVELDQHSRITIQILPFGAGILQGLRGGFSILEPRQPNHYPHLVYLERPEGSRIVTSPHEVETYAAWFDELAAAAVSLRSHRRILSITEADEHATVEAQP